MKRKRIKKPLFCFDRVWQMPGYKPENFEEMLKLRTERRIEMFDLLFPDKGDE